MTPIRCRTVRTAAALGALCLALACHDTAGAADPCPPRPNVILILTDDLGWGDLPYFGSPIEWGASNDPPAANAVPAEYKVMRPTLNRLEARLFADRSAPHALGDFEGRREGPVPFAGLSPALPPFTVVPVDGDASHAYQTATGGGCADPNASSPCQPSTDVLHGFGGLTRMAHEGLAFSRFYAASAVCSASRASILTGRHVNEHNVVQGTSKLQHREVTIPEFLKQGCSGAGPYVDPGSDPAPCYRTALIGKWHVGSAKAGGPVVHGFDEAIWFSSSRMGQFKGTFSCTTNLPDPVVPGCGDACTAAPGSAIGELKVAGANDTSAATHECNQDAGLTCASGGSGCAFSTRVYRDLAISAIDRLAAGPEPFFLMLSLQGVHDPYDAPRRTAQHYKKPDARRLSPNMWAHVEEIDAAVGRILDHLETSGQLASSTVVLFTSDHGRGAGGDVGSPLLRGGKFSTWEGGLRTGLLAWGCDIQASDDLAREVGSQTDLFRTVADLAGVSLPAQIRRCSKSGAGCATTACDNSDPDPAKHDGICESVTIRGQSLLPLLRGETSATGPQHALANFKRVGKAAIRPLDASAGVCGYSHFDESTRMGVRGASCQTCDDDSECSGASCAVLGRVCVDDEAQGICDGASGSKAGDRCTNDSECVDPSSPAIRGGCVYRGLCDASSGALAGNPCAGDADCGAGACTPIDVGRRCFDCKLDRETGCRNTSKCPVCPECGDGKVCRQISVPCSGCFPTAWKLRKNWSTLSGLFELNTNPEEDKRADCVASSDAEIAGVRQALATTIESELEPTPKP